MISPLLSLKAGRVRASRFAEWVRAKPGVGLVAATALYAALSFVYWGLPLLGHWTTRVVGSSNDPTDIFVWAMAWWPYAVTHGQNPFQIANVWLPLVTNAGWRTVVPGLSLLFAPITLTAGPVASYNVAMLLAPALTAAAMCLLMYELTHHPWVSLWAGYMVGFSSYEVSQMLAHLHLTFVCLVPLALWVGVRLYRRSGQFMPWGLVAGLAAIVLGQFLISTEVLATMTLFAALAWVLAWLMLPDERPALRRFGKQLLAVYAIAGLVLSPWLWNMAHQIPFQHVGSAYSAFSLNLLNLVVPTSATLGGGWFRILNDFASGAVQEASGYMGLPFLGLTVWVMVRNRSRRVYRLIVWMMVFVGILALGPNLRVGSWVGPTLPWDLLRHWPFFDVFVTGRFMLYVFILAAGAVSWHVSRARSTAASRWGALGMLLAVVALLPNLSHRGMWSAAIALPLVTHPAWLARYVPPHAHVLVLPYFARGPSTFWQEASGFRFELADGYLYGGINSTWTLLKLPYLLTVRETPTDSYAALELRALLVLGRVRRVLVALPETVRDRALLQRAGLRADGMVGGVGVWTVPPSESAGPVRGAQARFRLALSTRLQVLRSDLARVAAAARQYVTQDRSAGSLSLAALEQVHLLAAGQGHQPARVPGWQETLWGVWLKDSSNQRVSLVVREIPQSVFRQLVQQYRPELAHANFIPMARVSSAQPSGMTLGAALLVFRAVPGRK